MKELSELLGVSIKTIKKYLQLEFNYKYKNGEYLVPAFAEYGKIGSRKKIYCVNPVLMRRTVKQTSEIIFKGTEEWYIALATQL